MILVLCISGYVIDLWVMCNSIFQAYEEEIAFQQSQHKEIVNALAEREKEFKVFAAETQKLKKQLHAKVQCMATDSWCYIVFWASEILWLHLHSYCGSVLLMKTFYHFKKSCHLL